MSTRYTLTADEIALAKRIGTARYMGKRQQGLTNRKQVPIYGAKLDTFAFAAELAFCRLAGLEPDTEIGIKAGSADAVLLSGLTVDVKATKGASYRLLSEPEKQSHGIDFYVLMTGDIPTFTFRGWATHAELFMPCNLKVLNPKYKTPYSLPQSRLHHSLTELLDWGGPLT